MDTHVSMQSQFQWRQWIAAFAASSIMFGAYIDIPWENRINPFSSKGKLWVEAIYLILGAFTGAVIADTFGRRRTLLATSIFVIPRFVEIDLIMQASQWIIGPFFSFGSGVTCVVVPLYISELSGTKNGGRLMLMQQSVLYLGLVAIFTMNIIFSPSDVLYGHTNKLLRNLLAVTSMSFHITILCIFPETPHYLNWKKRYQETAETLAFYGGGIGPVRLTNDPIRSMIPNVNNERNGFCERISEIFEFNNRKYLMMIFSLTVIRRASGEDWNLQRLWTVLTIITGSEINYLPYVVLMIALLVVSILIMLSMRTLSRKLFLLITISTSYFAAIIAATSLVKHYFWLYVLVIYVQNLAQRVFLGVGLAFAGEFFLINIRSIGIATVISWEVLTRCVFFLIFEKLEGFGLLEEEYVLLRCVINCAVLVIALYFILIVFPQSNKVPSSEIEIVTVAVGECVLVEKLSIC